MDVLLGLSDCAKFKKIPYSRFFRKKKNVLGKTIYIIFLNLLAPFTVQNFKKIIRADPELWPCITFRPKIASKKLLQFSCTTWPLSPYIVENILKILWQIQDSGDVSILEPKRPTGLNKNFFTKSKSIFLI